MSEATVRCPKCGHDGIVITELLNSDLALLADSQAAEIQRLRGVANLLADQLAQYTGYPVPRELGEAERAVAAGGDSWDSIRRVYVNDEGRKV